MILCDELKWSYFGILEDVPIDRILRMFEELKKLREEQALNLKRV